MVFLNGTIKIVHTALWLHYLNKNVFSNRWNLLYNKFVRIFQVWWKTVP